MDADGARGGAPLAQEEHAEHSRDIMACVVSKDAVGLAVWRDARRELAFMQTAVDRVYTAVSASIVQTGVAAVLLPAALKDCMALSDRFERSDV
ncbi:hypothetical protein FVE85_9537 [Porphyridium purpureum]|uniref:Uncharacterized protein n=1 Tax=Porphyridium purpureum TaxID=35688 RepID=A0A5J4YJK9_PORPP|nr:hypothetical protein FVE85_9537 [Porphyridium purpureum]|eukprot:POR9574..scf261_15